VAPVDVVDGVLDLLPGLFPVVVPMLVTIDDGVLGLLRDFVSRLLDLESEECAEFTDDRRLFELAAELRRLDVLARVADLLTGLLRELFRLVVLVDIADDVLERPRDFVSRLLDLESEECAEFTDDRRLFELAAELRRLDVLARVADLLTGLF